MAAQQHEVTALPPEFTGGDGRLYRQSLKGNFYETEQAGKFKTVTLTDARVAWSAAYNNANNQERPAIFEMTDEELADTANIDFAAEEQQDKQVVAEEQQPTSRHKEKEDPILDQLLAREQALADAATRSIVFSPPLISRADAGIIGRGTINIIQGAYGSHKSRLAELMAALMLTGNTTDPQFLEFKRTMLERFCVCYIDTERNQREELPAAVQGIKTRAGFGLTDRPREFRFTSIKAVDRASRFKAITAFIAHVRAGTSLHVFALIDVVTDAVSSFNSEAETMLLFDLLGNLCDEHDCTFLLVIHQNPGTEKARGHTGTEAANKASTALQIGFEKDGKGNDTNIIRLRYLKLRRGKRPEPLYLEFSDETKQLVLSDPASVAAHINSRKQKADIEDVADRLVSLLSERPVQKTEVWKVLESEFDASNATIRDRLKTIIEDRPAMFNEEGRAVHLTDYNEGRNQFYELSLIE